MKYIGPPQYQQERGRVLLNPLELRARLRHELAHVPVHAVHDPSLQLALSEQLFGFEAFFLWAFWARASVARHSGPPPILEAAHLWAALPTLHLVHGPASFLHACVRATVPGHRNLAECSW